MSDNIRKLNVVTPTEDIRQDTINLLTETLAAAKAGEIQEVFICAKTPDGFRELASPTQHFCQWIGRLEIQKQGWINSFLDHGDTD